VPFAWRARLAYDGELLGAVTRVCVSTILGFYTAQTERGGAAARHLRVNRCATMFGMANLPLVRTEGKAFAAGPTLSPDRFAALPPLARASKSDVTRQVEADFRLGDCLYFYAGHAWPGFGDVVLVYEATMADADQGSATPFDTGGLHA
jgi:hypothetical protein